MSTLEFWPKLLMTYGPFALIVFMVYVVVKKAKPTPNAAGAVKILDLCVYGGAWAFVFFLGVRIVQVWIKLNIPTTQVISGTIRGLQDPESVWSDPDSPLFVKRVYKDQTQERGHYDYAWRIITAKKQVDPVTFTFQDKSGNAKTYRLDIKDAFYGSPVNIDYHRGPGTLVLREGAKEQPLPVMQIALNPVEPSRLIGIVYAQSESSIGDIGRALASDDPFIRRSARDDLAKQGTQAIPYISSALTRTGSPYRTKLGVITALNKMNPPEARGISNEAKHAVLQLAMTEQDQTLRAAAIGYMGSIVSNDRLLREMRPSALGLLPSGIVVLDANNRRILQATATGLVNVKDVPSYKLQDLAAGQLDDQDAIFVLMKSPQGPIQDLLTLYTPQGTKRRSWTFPVKAANLAFDAKRQLVYAIGLRTDWGELYRLNPRTAGSSFQFVAELAKTTRSIGGIAVDGIHNRVFVAGDMLQVVDLGATRPRARILLEGGLGTPLAIALNPTGSILYGADSAGGRVWKVSLDAASAQVSNFSRDARYRKPNALHVDSAGNVWLGDSDASAIFVLSPEGEVVGTLSAKR